MNTLEEETKNIFNSKDVNTYIDHKPDGKRFVRAVMHIDISDRHTPDAIFSKVIDMLENTKPYKTLKGIVDRENSAMKRKVAEMQKYKDYCIMQSTINGGRTV